MEEAPVQPPSSEDADRTPARPPLSGRLSGGELVELAGHPEAAERPVTDGSSPLTVVDLDGPGWDALVGAEPALPWRVVAGVLTGAPDRPPPAALDVALCTGDPAPGWVRATDAAAAVAELGAAVEANPRASAVLCQLLRVNERLSPAGGLVAESFAYSMLLGGPEFAAWIGQRTITPHRLTPEPVTVEWEGDTVRVVLNRPEVRNAYDAGMRDALVDVLRGLAALPEPPAVVLAANGPAFSSGGDLSQFGTTPDPVTAHAVRTARSPGLLLRRLNASAVVHGACVGAGMELPAFCPRITARADATFRLPEVGMGLVPGAGGTASITARIGRHRTAWLAITGAAITVEVAAAWGLVDEIA